MRDGVILLLCVIGRVVLALDYPTRPGCNWIGCVGLEFYNYGCLFWERLCWLGIFLLVLSVIGFVVLVRDYHTGVVCNWNGCDSSGLPYWCCM